MTTTADILRAMKVPRHLLPWKSRHGVYNARLHEGDAFLFHAGMAGLHLVNDQGYGGYTVMDDSDRELARHLNAIRHARGHVLKTGLGFGCFVRGALLNPEVKRIDVIEINQDILVHFGAEFEDNPRVKLIHGDALALKIAPDSSWDMAWHDIYCDGNDGLAKLHSLLIMKFARHAKQQGAWGFPRKFKKAYSKSLGRALI